MGLLDSLVKAGAELAVDFLRRELTAPDGWVADPKTRTIQRKRAPRARRKVKAAQHQPDGDIIDLCPRCFSAHDEGDPCPSD